MEKNLQKYNTYTHAMRRVNAAIAAGFFLEAITIEESILADRLLRVCNTHGYKRTPDKSTLGAELTFMRQKIPDQLDALEFSFLHALEAFWKDRNACLHEIAKSSPDTATRDFEDLMRLAGNTAIAGKELVRKVGDWAAKYKTKVMKATG